MPKFVLLDEKHYEEIISLAGSIRSNEFNWDRQKLLASFQGAELYGAVNDSGVLDSFVLLRRINNETCEIECLASRTEVQGRGHMFLLMTWLFSKLNGTAQEIWLEVHEKNQKALALYAKLGFRQMGIRKGYYPDGSAAILCTKNI